MKNQERETLIKEYISAYNDMKVEKMLSPLHSELIFENFSGDEKTHFLVGKKAFKNQALEALGYFSERNQSILNITHQKSNSKVTISYQATLRIDIPNGPRKGDKLDFEGKSIFEFKDNKISKIQDFS
ncbi:nuclear transport factor 2 family protein [Algoriphagus zhangzhouensis]|uniref:SnoaL-like domain-containing protein n=1 Tax=Algoriphagus zhangzhouensis TaxID=1073327 RepID=A0A1M7ZHN5_9BACT|nr:nuclear transport factor 2 family protein [Algoriphagus zhangzhouensis]TDY44232.1 SnoaL-like protein [Algoriphagus zhangzhouensis]SHO64420.1 SnoaL-like domain-containing protein [Algoriphagus zhangzhouensis]